MVLRCKRTLWLEGAGGSRTAPTDGMGRVTVKGEGICGTGRAGLHVGGGGHAHEGEAAAEGDAGGGGEFESGGGEVGV